MLSIEKLTTAQKASDYYQEENYYAKEGESVDSNSLQGIWVGKGAEMLNLRGNASVKQFKAVLEGKLSPDILMENVKQGKYHRPGYDLTFSAPKSVSILAVLAQDKDVLNAHRRAIAGVLKHIETHYAGTRCKKQGKTTIEQTGNLIMCTFEHNDSRMLDPNLHTHVIIMNAVLRSDNRWRTLFSEAFYEDKITLGMHYRALLAQELMKLGFEIEQTSEKGTFEIKDFPEILIKQLSKRRAQIEAYMEEHGLKGAEAAKIANFNTRPNKQKVDAEHLTLAWTIELMQHGYSLEWLQNFCLDAKTRGPIAPLDPILLAKQSLDLAVRHLSIFQPVFSLPELKKAALGLSILNGSPLLLQQSIETQFKKGELLYLGNGLCTTQIARDTEIENAAALRLDKKQVHPLFSPLAAKYALSKSGLATQSQKEALSFLLKSSDRQVAIQYENKKDQSLLMHAYLKAIQHHGLYPVGLTQEPVRVEPFGEALGLERVQTIEGFLVGCGFRSQELRLQAANPNQPLPSQIISSKRSPNFGKLKKPARPKSGAALKNAREIWILDASSPISLLQVRQLQGYATQFGARIIWAHHPFNKQSAIRSMIQYGISHIALSGSSKIPLGDWLKQKEIVKSFEYLIQQQKITAIPD
ncbi:MAG TPA: MobF family relaxase, partial [Gammaproteobacteria bacterium]|nr:MobF family relaxase [Gammaproteobacteria bacterium]